MPVFIITFSILGQFRGQKRINFQLLGFIILALVLHLKQFAQLPGHILELVRIDGDHESNQTLGTPGAT